MTIKTIAFAITALILTATTSEAKINLSQEFCGDRYCGYYRYDIQKYHQKRVHKNVSRKAEKARAVAKTTANDKEKQAGVPLPLPKPETVVSDLISRAKRYLGTNPTGWSSVWCGRFMAMVAPEAAKKIGNPNLAINWAKLPRTTARIGAILITRRSGGNHVGVVIGFNKKGYPITISGNHGRKVGIGTYPTYKIVAYVTA